MIHLLKQPSPSSLHNLFILFILGGIVLLTNSVLNAQEKDILDKSELQLLVSKTDSLLGADDELINGKIYIQENLLAQGHPFFLTNDWQAGSVKVNGKEHDGLFLKYNINTGELILKAERKRGGASVIALNNEFIETFIIGDRFFINAMNFDVKGIQTDFVELLYQGRFNFFVSYSKSYNNDYTTKTPYGTYGKISTSYFLMQENQLTNITSKNAFLNYFITGKKEIKKYMKKNKIKYGKANFDQLSNLMEYSDQLSKRQ